MPKSMHIEDDFKKKKRPKRNKSGLIIHTPINGLKNEEFKQLIAHHKEYTQVLLAYVKNPDSLEIPGSNHTFFQLKTVFKEYHIHSNKKERIIIARTKREALNKSGIPIRDIGLIGVRGKNGMIRYLKTGGR